jgi:hypothetical protein
VNLGQTIWLSTKNTGKTIKNCTSVDFSCGFGLGAKGNLGAAKVDLTAVPFGASIGYNSYSGEGFYYDPCKSSFCLGFGAGIGDFSFGGELGSSTTYEQWAVDKYGMLFTPEIYKDHTYTQEVNIGPVKYGNTYTDENGITENDSMLSIGAGGYILVGGEIDFSINLDEADDIWNLDDYKEIWKD